MAGKVDTFVELAADELRAIRQQLEAVAINAQKLSNRWAALGKTNMAGWAEYNWAGQPFTAQELALALNGLSVAIATEDATNLTNVHAGRAVDKIVKASL